MYIHPNRYRTLIAGCATLACLVLTGCPAVPPETTTPPTAAFSATPTAGTPGVSVNFTDASDPGSAEIRSWLWRFGDGATSTVQHPAHVYAVAGRYSVALTVTSAAGEDTHAVEELIVVLPEQDTAPPEITLYGDRAVVLECGASWRDPGGIAVDAEERRVVPLMVGGDTVQPGVPGVYTITYDAVDGAGNAAPQQVRTVTVADDAAPLLALHGGDVEMPCGGVYVDAGVRVTDACDGAPVLEVSGNVDGRTPGTYTLQYTARDAAGNMSATLTREVMVVDDTAPVIRLNGGDILLDCAEAYEELGATAVDACEGDVSVAISGEVPASGTGTFTIAYTAVDGAGNGATAVRRVRRADTEAPVILLEGGDMTLECGAHFTDPGANATDNCDPAVTVQVHGAVSSWPNTYRLTYGAVDSAGNAADQVVREVTVVDSTPPVIVLNGGDMMVDRGYPFNDPGASAHDACSGEAAVRVEGHVDIHESGVYPLHYRAQDVFGNRAEVTREVTVVEHCTDGTPWSRIYGRLEGKEEDARVLQTRDCGFVYLGERDFEFAYDRENYLLKTDAAGNPLWERQIAFANEDPDVDFEIVDVAELPTGELYVLGRRDWYFDQVGMSALLLSEDGELIEQITYDIPHFWPEAALVTRRGDIYVCGARFSGLGYLDQRQWLAVAKLRGTAELDWFQRYDLGVALDLQEAPGGDLVLGGYLYEDSPYYTHPTGFRLQRMTPAGELVWETQVDLEGAEEVNDFTVLSDGGVIVVRGSSYFVKQWELSDMIRFDAQGQELWVQDAEPDILLTQVAPAEEGAVVVGGVRFFVEHPIDGSYFLQKLDAAGNTAWSREDGGARMEFMTDLIATDEGGYLAAGQSSSFSSVCRSYGNTVEDECDDLWAIKLDADGNAPAEPVPVDTPGWVATYAPAEGQLRGRGIASRGEGAGYVAVANSESFPDRPTVFAIDEDGVPEWVQTVDMGVNFQDIASIIALSDGGFAVAGDFLDSRSRMLAIRLASDGTILWTYASQHAESMQAYDLAETPDGGLILAGTALSPGAASDQRRGCVVRLDAEGTEVWRRFIGTGEYAHFTTVTAGEGDMYGLLLHWYGTRDDDDKFVMIDGSGDVVSERVLDQYRGSYLTDLLALEDGGWILGGLVYSENEQAAYATGLLARVTQDLTVTWERTVPSAFLGFTLAWLPNGNLLAGSGNDATTFLSEWTLDGEQRWERPQPLTRLGNQSGSLLATSAGIVGIGNPVYYYDGAWGAMIFKADLEGRTDREVIHHVLQ